MLYKKLLEDEYIKNIYNGIENNKRIPISHGMPHILNVISYCSKFASYLIWVKKMKILY